MGTLAAIALALVLVLLSHRFGRAEPDGGYRPDLPPDALASGCFPLPGDVTFDFGYQVRGDTDVDRGGVVRRIVQGQYDGIDEPEALAAIVSGFAEAGLVASEQPAPYDAVLVEPGADPDVVVGVVVSQLNGIEDDAIVRGTFVLDLPVIETPARDAEECHDPAITKRWVFPIWANPW
jgi:hypothetical protein